MRNLLLGGLLLLTGCAHHITWSAVDSREYRRDNYECVQQSGTFGGGSGLAGAAMILAARAQANRLYRMCMEARGYEEVN